MWEQEFDKRFHGEEIKQFIKTQFEKLIADIPEKEVHEQPNGIFFTTFNTVIKQQLRDKWL
jgi:hypothetical protein